MIDPFALWKALRHFSLTFAVVFASTLLGASVTSLLSRLLGALSLPWLVLWLVPIVVVAMVAKREARWFPDEKMRQRLAQRIVVGSILLWAGWVFVRSRYGDDEPPPSQTAPAEPKPPVRRGPPNR